MSAQPWTHSRRGPSRRPSRPNASVRPFVSVLTPVRNEERYIERCLYSIARQDYPRDRVELIVIDGDSADSTRQLVARFAAESTVDVRLLHNPARTPAAGMNSGLDAARGDVIVRLDGHAYAPPDFLTATVAALRESGADCAGGVLESEGDGYAGRAIALAMSSPFGVGGAAFRTGGRGRVDTVAFGAYHRAVFDRIGRFAEDIEGGEDDEFNYRLLDHGGVIWMEPSIRPRYTVRQGFGGLWRQYLRYGLAKPEVLRRHPSQARLRHVVPAALVGGLALAPLIRPRAALALSAAYAAAVVLASAATAARRGWRYAPALPAAFACLHVAYGTGFILGAVRVATSAVTGGTAMIEPESTGAAR